MRNICLTSYYISDYIDVRSENTSTKLGFSLPQTKITMKFSWTCITKQWRPSSDTVRCVSMHTFPLPTNQDTINLTADELMHSGSSHRKMMNRFSGSWWAVDDMACRDLIESALASARETLNSNWPQDHDHLYLDFIMVKRVDTLRNDRDSSDDVDELDDSDIQISVGARLHELAYAFELERLAEGDDDNCSMIRTDDDSIESLEKKTAEREGSCVICLEDYSSRIEVTCMPCSHVFHEECIKKWLNVSHYCPTCRFEMPTTSGDHKA